MALESFRLPLSYNSEANPVAGADKKRLHNMTVGSTVAKIHMNMQIPV